MSDTITISNTFSFSGGIVETGAGTPVVEYSNPGALMTGPTTSSAIIVLGNPASQSGQNNGNGSSGSGGGSGSSAGPITSSDGSGGTNNDSGGGGASPQSTCAEGDPGNNPPGTYVAAAGPGAAQIESDAAALAGAIANLATLIITTKIGDAFGGSAKAFAESAAESAGADAEKAGELASKVFSLAKVVLQSALGGELELAEGADAAISIGVAIVGGEGAVIASLVLIAATLGVAAYVSEVGDQIEAVKRTSDAEPCR